MRVRESDRIISEVALLAAGVNADGHREVLSLRAAPSETGPARSEFIADLVDRGLAGRFKPAGVQSASDTGHMPVGAFLTYRRISYRNPGYVIQPWRRGVSAETEYAGATAGNRANSAYGCYW